MRIERIGFTPLKGGRHLAHPDVDLSADGPVGDRVFCLVDPVEERVLRTVQNPTLLATSARCESGVLTVRLPGETVQGVPSPTGHRVKADYWGRSAALEVVEGPWAAAFSGYLGRDVVLARADPGQVVYAGSVSIVTTGSMRLLSDKLGDEVESERFRSTFLVDTEDLEPHVEDSWVGGQLEVGTARLRVCGALPRCAVLDLEPGSGLSDAQVLHTLAGYRRGDGELNFGVHAVVTRPGRVATGDFAELMRS